MNLQRLLRETDRMGQELRGLKGELERQSPLNSAGIASRGQRTEQGFALLNRSRFLLESLRDCQPGVGTERLRRRLRRYSRIAHRINRESPVLSAGDAPAIPIREFKNFHRDGYEHMYFLALHPFPSAFDFFCTTYVETPQGYRQEQHLHKRSVELTLVLEGEADCVWYQAVESGTEKAETGRVTARAGEAFRIPQGVVHAIDNPHQDNRNISVKLTMFIDDRLGQQEPEFQRTRGQVLPVTVDRGTCRETAWGTTTRFQHEYHGLRFQYRLDVIRPGGTFTGLPPGSFAFLYDGVLQQKLEMPQDSRLILHSLEATSWTNPTDREARLFSVEGLDHRAFLTEPERFPQFPAWCRLAQENHLLRTK
jgi:hypothetical protein